MTTPAQEASSSHKSFQNQKLTEEKFDLAQLMEEVILERQTSTLAKQIIDQKEIQKTITEYLKKSRGNTSGTVKS